MYGTLISSVTVGAGGAASIDFTSIPQTYTDLVLVCSLRDNLAAVTEGLWVGFNGSTTGYTGKALYGANGSVSSFSSSNRLVAFAINGSTSTANTFSNVIVTIPNYAGSTNKSYSTDAVSESNGTSEVYANIWANLWSNTSAITSITILSSNAATLSQYSTAYLYGLTKGSGGATVS